MNNVIAPFVILQIAVNPLAEGERFGKTAGADIQEFIHVERAGQIS
jgi:hypothetical protein